MKIAILGCTGQIGRCLVRAFASRHDLMLYARRPQTMQDWLAETGHSARVLELSELPAGDFDLIINAIGDGVPGKISIVGSRIIETTEHFDRQCLDYLDRKPDCGYVFLSTGRIYGEAYEAAQQPDPQPLALPALSGQWYPLAKLQAELRHRHLTSRRIADIRIFGFVSDEINLDDDFLVAQILQALVHEVEFVTTPHDLIRDYVGPEHLCRLINKLIDAGIPNGAYDLCSAAPVMKFELLQALAGTFGLCYDISGLPENCSAEIRSVASELISRHTGSQGIGYVPSDSSLDAVFGATQAILQRTRTPDRCCAP